MRPKNIPVGGDLETIAGFTDDLVNAYGFQLKLKTVCSLEG